MSDNGQQLLIKSKIEGTFYKTKNSGGVEVIEYISAKEIVVKFCNTGTIKKVSRSALNRGGIRDSTRNSVYGVGICDIPSKHNGKPVKSFLPN